MWKVLKEHAPRLEFRDATAATCEGLAHGSCWPDAEEPGEKYDLEGKGAALLSAMAT